tara:strand:+ start:15909 stop:17687 length:1779 start_codon:yes stop_codon:yes gene_type:complete
MAEKIIFDFDFGGNSKETTEELESLKDELEGIKGELSAIKGAQKGTTKALGGIAKGFKGIGLAMKTAGIGLIIEAFNFLKEILSKNQRVMDMVTIATEALSIVFNKVASVAVDLGSSIYESFSNPKEAVLGLWDAIKTNIVNRIEGLIDTFKAVGSVIKSALDLDFEGMREGAKKAKTGLIQMTTGLDEVQQNAAWETIKQGATALVEVGKAAITTATEIKDLRNEVIGLEADQRLLNFQYLKEQESQRQIRDDITETFEARIEANDKLKESLEKQLADEKRILNKKLELAQLEAAANVESVELAAAVTDQLAELADLEERINGFRSEQIVNRVALELEQKAILDELKLAELTEKEAEFEELKQDYDRKVEMARIAGVETTAIDEKYALDKKAITDRIAAETKAAADKVIADNLAATKKQKDIDKLAQKQKIDGLKQGVQMAEGLFGKSEKDQKRFALAKIGIDTAESISSLMAVSEANPLNTVTFGGAGMIQWGLGILRILTNVKAAKDLLSGKGGTTPPSTSGGGGGGGGGGGSSAASSFTPNFASGGTSFDLAASTSSLSQQPLQAYVVQQDVQDQTEISTQIQNRATL